MPLKKDTFSGIWTFCRELLGTGVVWGRWGTGVGVGVSWGECYGILGRVQVQVQVQVHVQPELVDEIAYRFEVLQGGRGCVSGPLLRCVG